MIQTFIAEHGGVVFVSAPSRRQKRLRSRLVALTVIAVVGASAGTVQAFNDHQRRDAARMWSQ